MHINFLIWLTLTASIITNPVLQIYLQFCMYVVIGVLNIMQKFGFHTDT